MAHWHKMLKLIRNSDENFGNLKIKVLNNIGDDYMLQCNWQAAVKYYELANNTEKLIECFLHMDDYDALDRIASKLPDNDPRLERIAKKFAADGVFPEVIWTYEKLGDIQTLKNYCVSNNKWSSAFQLSIKYKLLDVPDLFAKHCVNVLGEYSLEKSVQINFEAGYYKHAAEHSFRLARLESEKPVKNPSKIYGLYVYGGKLCRLYRLNYGPVIADDAMLTQAWKGAEAYYFLKKWYSLFSLGHFKNALIVSCKLQDYVNYLPKEVIYFALALSSFRFRQYKVCSQAFIKLKSLQHLSNSLKKLIDATAVDVFLTRHPRNARRNSIQHFCDNCDAPVADWVCECSECDNKFRISIVTGLPLFGNDNIWRCSTCNNFAEEDRILIYDVCPLCHSSK